MQSLTIFVGEADIDGGLDPFLVGAPEFEGLAVSAIVGAVDTDGSDVGSA